MNETGSWWSGVRANLYIQCSVSLADFSLSGEVLDCEKCKKHVIQENLIAPFQSLNINYLTFSKHISKGHLLNI